MCVIQCNAFISVSNRHLALKNESDQFEIPVYDYNCVLLKLHL